MRKIFLGSALAFCLSLVLISSIKYLMITIEEPSLKTISNVAINKNIGNVINIKDKVAHKQVTKNVNYLNSWKLSATAIGSTPYAMVIKGRDSKILRLNSSLENYKVKQILKNKVLFEKGNDKTWLYIKDAIVKVRHSVLKVMPKVGTFVMRKTTFKRNFLRPEKLLKTLNIVPEMVRGIFNGLKIKYLLEGSFLYKYGLRQDDIIKSINGKKLVSISDGISAYQNISTSKKFSVSVLRDNKIKELKYEIVK